MSTLPTLAAELAAFKEHAADLEREQETAIYELLRVTTSLRHARIVIERREARLQAYLAQSAHELSAAPSAAATETNKPSNPPAAPAGEPTKG